ncbi:hypothetical protein ACJJIF_08225 [Microbulbifer sp. SSSA002]
MLGGFKGRLFKVIILFFFGLDLEFSLLKVYGCNQSLFGRKQGYLTSKYVFFKKITLSLYRIEKAGNLESKLIDLIGWIIYCFLGDGFPERNMDIHLEDVADSGAVCQSSL